MGVFDPRRTTNTFNKVPISGYAKGSFIKISRRSKVGDLEDLGPDGEGAFVLTGDNSYEIEITLKRSSPSNTYLSGLLVSAELGAPVVGAWNTTDGSTGTVFDADEAMLVEWPDLEREGGEGAKLGDNVWKFVAKSGRQNQLGFES